MVVPQKPILFVVLVYLLISCSNLEKEQHKSTPNKNTIPSSEYKKSGLPVSKPEILEPNKTPKKKRGKRKN
jgi:hypothetical protein